MHEISLVRSIINSLEEEFSQSELDTLETIHLDIGKLSNIEPRLMDNAFDAVRSADQKFLEVSLAINVVPIIIHCNSCDVDTEVTNYKFYCSSCNQPNNNVVKGTEMLIRGVEFRD